MLNVPPRTKVTFAQDGGKGHGGDRHVTCAHEVECTGWDSTYSAPPLLLSCCTRPNPPEDSAIVLAPVPSIGDSIGEDAEEAAAKIAALSSADK